MRAHNYKNTRLAYTPWSHTEMVRSALVEGLSANLQGITKSEIESRLKDLPYFNLTLFVEIPVILSF